MTQVKSLEYYYIFTNKGKERIFDNIYNVCVDEVTCIIHTYKYVL